MLQDIDTEMYSTHDKGKSVVAERLISTVKNKIFKYLTSITKNVHVDKLDDIVNEYNNTYQNGIKMKSADVKSRTYIDFDGENKDKDPKFEVGGHTKTSKYKNTFAKHYTQIGQEKFL